MDPNYPFLFQLTSASISIMVPALIIQPFIENAIWHGLMPNENGGILTVSISKRGDQIYCVVEDNGIGRNVSIQNKSSSIISDHQSQGVRLTQTRLKLSNSLNQRNATVEIIDKTNTRGEAEGSII